MKKRTGEERMIVGDCRTEEGTGTSLRKGVSVGMPSTETYRIAFSVHKRPAHQTTDSDVENKTHTRNPSESYLPIMVECCWTAASSSLSKIVHSPMVMVRWQCCERKQDLGSQPLFVCRTPSFSFLWTCWLGGVHPAPSSQTNSLLTSTR